MREDIKQLKDYATAWDCRLQVEDGILYVVGQPLGVARVVDWAQHNGFINTDRTPALRELAKKHGAFTEADIEEVTVPAGRWLGSVWMSQ
jgi:hypothetical protein